MVEAEGFTVKLARSGKEVFVPRGGSILFALMDAGVSVPFSCGGGICGACEQEVLSGIPEHRDFVLSDEERASNESILICCSGSKTDVIELNI